MTFDFVVFHIIVRIVYFSLLLHDITSLIFFFFFLAGKADQEGENTWSAGDGEEMRIKLTPGKEVEKQNKKRFLVLQDVKSRQKTPNTSDLTVLY